MTEKELYFTITGVVIWIGLSIYASIMATRYFTINKSRLNLNIILIWLVPILWSLFVISLTRKEEKRKKDGYKYHESGYSQYSKWGDSSNI